MDRRHATGHHLEAQQTSQQHNPALPQSRDSKNAVAMFPPPPSRVISVEHGYRDSRLSAVSHTENAEEKTRRVVKEMSELTKVRVQLPPLRPLGEPQISRRLLLKQQTQAVNDRIPAKGCRHILDKPWAIGTGKGNVSAVRDHHQRQRRDHWNQQIGPEETGERRGETASQQDGGGTHGAGSGAGRGRRSQEVAERPMWRSKQPRTK